MGKHGSFIIILFLAGLIFFIGSQVFSGSIKLDKTFSIFGSPARNNSSTPIIKVTPKKTYIPKTTTKGNTNNTKNQKPKIIPPKGFTVNQLSPYYKKIKIQSAYGSQYFGNSSSFTLQADYGNKKNIDVTGWKIKSNREGIIISQGVSDYSYSGTLNLEDIQLRPNDYLYAYGKASPIGRNFRLNKCTGYLNEKYSFDPSLPSSCPSDVNSSEVRSFPGDCQSFIYSISGSCRTPSAKDLNRFTSWIYQGCRKYLDKFNYGTCYREHRNDPDFFSNEWRVWIGRQLSFDTQHDTILLFDKNGLLVDMYSY